MCVASFHVPSAHALYSGEGGILTDDRRAPLLALADEERQQLASDEHVQVDGDFVEEEDVPFAHEAHTELDTTSFAVRDLVHAPGTGKRFVRKVGVCKRGGAYQSRSTSNRSSNMSRRSGCLYPPTESRKCATPMSDLMTGLFAHSVPR
jgi:hypothetical protein